MRISGRNRTFYAPAWRRGEVKPEQLTVAQRDFGGSLKTSTSMSARAFAFLAHAPLHQRKRIGLSLEKEVGRETVSACALFPGSRARRSCPDSPCRGDWIPKEPKELEASPWTRSWVLSPRSDETRPAPAAGDTARISSACSSRRFPRAVLSLCPCCWCLRGPPLACTCSALKYLGRQNTHGGAA